MAALSRRKKIYSMPLMWVATGLYVENSTKNERETMKFLKAFLIVLFATLLLAVVGGGCFQDLLTPCHIDEATIEYSGQEATSYVPWTTVWDAQRIRAYVNYMHVQTQNAYERLKKDDSLTHAFLLDGVDANIADAMELQALVFSPTSPLGAMLLAGGGLGLGALAIKRPGDKSKKEVELEKSVPA